MSKVVLTESSLLQLAAALQHCWTCGRSRIRPENVLETTDVPVHLLNQRKRCMWTEQQVLLH